MMKRFNKLSPVEQRAYLDRMEESREERMLAAADQDRKTGARGTSMAEVLRRLPMRSPKVKRASA